MRLLKCPQQCSKSKTVADLLGSCRLECDVPGEITFQWDYNVTAEYDIPELNPRFLVRTCLHLGLQCVFLAVKTPQSRLSAKEVSLELAIAC